MKARFAALLAYIFLLVSVSPAIAQKSTVPKMMVPEWSKLKAFYDYDRSKSPVFKTEVKPNDLSDAQHLEFVGPAGEKVTGIYAHPKGAGRYPCVLLLHGLTSNKETMALGFGINLVRQGFAILALDAPLHGERHQENANPTTPENFTKIIHEGCCEYRVAMDWLTKQKEIDSDRIGLIGYSMGSFMGAILGGVDTRVKAIALCVGGDLLLPMAAAAPAQNRDTAYSLCPSLFISHINGRPVLMLNGKQDTLVPTSAADRLFSAAKEPKEIIWYESGHLLPQEALDKSVSWIKSTLNSQKTK